MQLLSGRHTHEYTLGIARYVEPSHIMGKISFFAMCGDHLQLPPAPKSSGILALPDGTSDERTIGASIVNRVHYLFGMHTKTLCKLLCSNGLVAEL